MRRFGLVLTALFIVLLIIPSCALAKGIDDIFQARWGHTYYNNVSRRKFNLAEVLWIIVVLKGKFPWQEFYRADVFDCSEMSSYLEYVFERCGYTADIAISKTHAWVLIHDNVHNVWIPIEPTASNPVSRPISILKSSSKFVPYLDPEQRFKTIMEIAHTKYLPEFDWWNSKVADDLEEAAVAAVGERNELSLPEIGWEVLEQLHKLTIKFYKEHSRE